MPVVQPITVVQPQVAQIELKFAGPLVVGSIVDDVIDLTTLNHNYSHKLVWVKNEQANYFLKTGEGLLVTDWEKVGSRVIMESYNPEIPYTIGTTVYLSGKIYKAIQNVPIGYSPLDYHDYWLTISGEAETQRFIFTNKSNVLIYTEIRNPKFEIILGDVVLDEFDNPIIGTDGLIMLENKEIVEAYIKQREDLPNNNGVPYEIIFEEDSQSISLTGCINIK